MKTTQITNAQHVVMDGYVVNIKPDAFMRQDDDREQLFEIEMYTTDLDDQDRQFLIHTYTEQNERIGIPFVIVTSHGLLAGRCVVKFKHDFSRIMLRHIYSNHQKPPLWHV